MTAAVFVIPHQDDEFGIFPALRRHAGLGHAVHCVYMTDGGPLADRRCNESRAVLGSLGIAARHIHFAGCERGWRDGGLHRAFAECCAWLRAFLEGLGDIDAVYIPAWEGGHVDHDTAHMAALVAARGLDCGGRVWQYPLYNAYRCPRPLYHVMRPLPENGPVARRPIPWKDRLRYLGLCLRYPSQWKTWVGLFPGVAAQYLALGELRLQKAAWHGLERPYPEELGRLFYERRPGCSWQVVRAALAPVVGRP